MNRIAIFAHFDKESKIRPYVIAYLKGLKEVAEKIIFVSDCNLSAIELDKIKNLVDATICEKHGEYDFGSYKRGFLYAKKNGILNNIDELIFCNDSCYAPLFSFEEMFKSMSKRKLDFWGPIENRAKNSKRKHIQSFFVVFRKSVFKSLIFENFINSIKHIFDKKKIIEEYECGMTYILQEAGFKWDVYSKLSKNYTDAYIFLYKELIKNENYCFLKRTIPNYKARIFVFKLNDFIKKYTKYDYNLIEQDIKKDKQKMSLRLFVVMLYKFIFKIPYSLIKDHYTNKY